MYYWLLRYFIVLFLIISFLTDLEFILIFLSFLTIHFFFGVNSILKDYIHQKEIKLLTTSLGRLLLIFTYSTLLEIIL